MSEYVKKKYCATGTVRIKDTDVSYEAVSEDFPIYSETYEVDATMFTFSYVRSDISNYGGRPVLFAWNGGPGCGSIFVHMGLLSPMRVKCGEGPDMPQTAPFELVNNDNCLLDVCDVVVVDAIGTGYARLLNPDHKKDYCSTTQDAEAFINCIRAWLTAHNRWNSPIYIMGESYGTIRNAMIADGIFFHSGKHGNGTLLHLSGIIMLGSALNHAQEAFPIPSAVLNLPSIAAAHWYWHPDGKGTLEEFVEQCDRFCYEEYVQALALGDRMPEARRRAVAEKLHLYTGYPVEKLLEDQLNVDVFAYPAKGLRDEGKSIGIYDARFSLGRVKNPEKYGFFEDDASNAIGCPAFQGAFNGLWKRQLNIDTDMEYEEMWGGAEGEWDFKTKTPPAESLEKAMHRNPNLKVMFGMGYYDMLTTLGWVRYLVSHYDYPKDRLWLKYYNAGHMPYLGDSAAMQLEEDIKNFIRGKRVREDGND